jgi:hypothetical protein
MTGKGLREGIDGSSKAAAGEKQLLSLVPYCFSVFLDLEERRDPDPGSVGVNSLRRTVAGSSKVRVVVIDRTRLQTRDSDFPRIDQNQGGSPLMGFFPL